MPVSQTKAIRIYEKRQVTPQNRTGRRRLEGTVYQAHCPYCSYKSPIEQSKSQARLDVIGHTQKKHSNKIDIVKNKQARDRQGIK